MGSGHRLGSEGGGGATRVLVGGCGAGSAVGTRGWLSCGHSGGHRCTQAHRRLPDQGGFFFFKIGFLSWNTFRFTESLQSPCTPQAASLMLTSYLTAGHLAKPGQGCGHHQERNSRLQVPQALPLMLHRETFEKKVKFKTPRCRYRPAGAPGAAAWTELWTLLHLPSCLIPRGAVVLLPLLPPSDPPVPPAPEASWPHPFSWPLHLLSL